MLPLYVFSMLPLYVEEDLQRLAHLEHLFDNTIVIQIHYQGKICVFQPKQTVFRVFLKIYPAKNSISGFSGFPFFRVFPVFPAQKRQFFWDQ